MRDGIRISGDLGALITSMRRVWDDPDRVSEKMEKLAHAAANRSGLLSPADRFGEMLSLMQDVVKRSRQIPPHQFDEVWSLARDRFYQSEEDDIASEVLLDLLELEADDRTGDAA